MKKYLLVFIPLLLVVAAPMALRDRSETQNKEAKLRLNIITPHNEAIQREFGRAFSDWHEQKYGEKVFVNWRNPGGTSEIKRVLNGSFQAAKEGDREGIGLDIFFGGGAYDFGKQAKLGHLQPTKFIKKNPEHFGEEKIPAKLGGETFYDKNHYWVGACLSSFGICYNTDLLKQHKLPTPSSWSALADVRYNRNIALADPTKSGSVAKMFEMILQVEMQKAEFEGKTIEKGWLNGLRLIQRIGANARYFTDSSSKIPHDVGQGNAIAGMSIDFYGRTFSDILKNDSGESRLAFVAPSGETSVSVDPVAILKGAPNYELAEAFIEFVFSDKGQMLWNADLGTPYGPQHYALRRLPIRRDIYDSPQLLAQMIDGDEQPYDMAYEFTYRGELTGRLFDTIRFLVRLMCIDSSKELKEAWGVLIEADLPPEALGQFANMDHVTYEQAKNVINPILRSKNSIERVRLAKELGRIFRQNYKNATSLAKKGL